MCWVRVQNERRFRGSSLVKRKWTFDISIWSLHCPLQLTSRTKSSRSLPPSFSLSLSLLLSFSPSLSLSLSLLLSPSLSVCLSLTHQMPGLWMVSWDVNAGCLVLSVCYHPWGPLLGLFCWALVGQPKSFLFGALPFFNAQNMPPSSFFLGMALPFKPFSM